MTEDFRRFGSSEREAICEHLPISADQPLLTVIGVSSLARKTAESFGGANPCGLREAAYTRRRNAVVISLL